MSPVSMCLHLEEAHRKLATLLYHSEPSHSHAVDQRNRSDPRYLATIVFEAREALSGLIKSSFRASKHLEERPSCQSVTWVGDKAACRVGFAFAKLLIVKFLATCNSLQNGGHTQLMRPW